MHLVLSHFIRQYLGIVCIALVPVILTAFLSIPFTLEGHPGDTRPTGPVVSQHMS